MTDRLREIDAELQKMIEEPGDCTIADYTNLQRKRSEVEKLNDPRVIERKEAQIQRIKEVIQGRNV